MIAIGSDHGGYELKEYLKTYLTGKGIEVTDVGCHGTESCDYPQYAAAVAEMIQEGKCEKGILCCGTGIGISIAANKHHGIRAALVSEPVSASLASEHNNANILCLGGRVTGNVLAAACVDAWLETKFAGGRHAERIAKMKE